MPPGNMQTPRAGSHPSKPPAAAYTASLDLFSHSACHHPAGLASLGPLSPPAPAGSPKPSNFTDYWVFVTILKFAPKSSPDPDPESRHQVRLPGHRRPALRSAGRLCTCPRPLLAVLWLGFLPFSICAIEETGKLSISFYF